MVSHLLSHSALGTIKIARKRNHTNEFVCLTIYNIHERNYGFFLNSILTEGISDMDL
jgi:hypothetical protein